MTKDDMQARIAWADIAEPDDVRAGQFTQRLGHRAALTTLAEAPTLGYAHRAVEDIAAARVPLSVVRLWLDRLDRHDLDAIRAAVTGADATAVDPRAVPGIMDLGYRAPHALFVLGDVAALRGTQRRVAIVGARSADSNGLAIAQRMAHDFAEEGVAVVSGGAHGVDAAAHRGALGGAGTTVAFLPTGIDQVYPAAHHALFAQIAAHGALVTELVPGTSPHREHFLSRNRLIAAYAQATVVVQAEARSGSMNTTGHAQQLGRPLAAVPGPPDHPMSEGPRVLIAERGARPVMTAGGVLSMLDRAERDA